GDMDLAEKVALLALWGPRTGSASASTAAVEAVVAGWFTQALRLLTVNSLTPAQFTGPITRLLHRRGLGEVFDLNGCRRRRESPISIPVGAATRQDPQDVDDACLGVALEAHAPVADPQTPFVSIRQLDDIASGRIAREPIEGTHDAALDRRVKTLEVASRPRRDDPAAARAQATWRLISSAESTSPRAISARASRAASSSSGIVGSSSSGAR